MDIINNKTGRSFLEETYEKINDILDEYEALPWPKTEAEAKIKLGLLQEAEKYRDLARALDMAPTVEKAVESLENILACHSEQYPKGGIL